MTTADKCNGEIESAGISQLSDPVRAGMEYSGQCLTCSRWAGYASEHAADMQDFVSIQFIEEEHVRRLCRSWLK